MQPFPIHRQQLFTRLEPRTQPMVETTTLQSESMYGDQVHAVSLTPDHIEQQILRAYVHLAVMPVQANDMRTATFARFEAIEVRLVEMPQLRNTSPVVPPFWLEVYCHATGTTVDSCGCFEFDETELAIAVDLV